MTTLQGNIATVTSRPNAKLPEIVDVAIKFTFSAERHQLNLDELNEYMGRAVDVRIAMVELERS